MADSTNRYNKAAYGLPGIYHSSTLTLVEGDGSGLGVDQLQNVKTNMATALDATNDAIQAVPYGNSYATISTATTTTIKSGSGVLHDMRVVGGTIGSIIAYDNTAGSGTTIVPATVTSVGSLVRDVAFGTGLTVVTSTPIVITVSYR